MRVERRSHHRSIGNSLNFRKKLLSDFSLHGSVLPQRKLSSHSKVGFECDESGIEAVRKSTSRSVTALTFSKSRGQSMKFTQIKTWKGLSPDCRFSGPHSCTSKLDKTECGECGSAKTQICIWTRNFCFPSRIIDIRVRFDTFADRPSHHRDARNRPLFMKF